MEKELKFNLPLLPELVLKGIENGELPNDLNAIQTAIDCVENTDNGILMVNMLCNQGLTVRDAMMNTIAGNVVFYQGVADLEAFKEIQGLTDWTDEEVLNCEDYMLTFENGNALNYVWHDYYTNEEFISAMSNIKEREDENKLIFDGISREVARDGDIVVCTTGRNYDFIAYIENQSQDKFKIEFEDDRIEPIELEGEKWVGILADEMGYYQLDQLKQGKFDVYLDEISHDDLDER